MQIHSGKRETSFALVSQRGRVVTTFDDKGEERARNEARSRGLLLFKLTLTAKEMPL